MTEKRLPDIAERQFAGAEGFLAEDVDRQLVVNSDTSAERADTLRAGESQSGAPASVDEALEARRTIARERS
jgi:hypothetical protein